MPTDKKKYYYVFLHRNLSTDEIQMFCDEWAPEDRVIPLENMRDNVGGWLEKYSFISKALTDAGIVMWANEYTYNTDGTMSYDYPTVVVGFYDKDGDLIVSDEIYGNVLFTFTGEDGETLALSEEQVNTVVDSLGYTVTSRNVNGQYTARLLLDDFYPMRG